MTLACGLILGAGLVVQPAFPQQMAAPQQMGAPQLQSESRPQASSVTAASNATLSFNLAPAVFSYPQSKVYPASFPDDFAPGQPGYPGLPGLPGQPGQPGTALKGDLAGVVEYAYAGLGRPYVWGGTSFISGWDCSGFVQWAYRHAGIELPRVSQWAVLRPTTTPSPGDLVTQRPDGPNHWAHVGIYVGNGMMISALNPDEGTVLHPVGPEGSSWFFTTSAGGGTDASSDLVAGGPFIDYRAPATGPSPAAVPAEGPSSDARQDSATKGDGKRRIEAATLSRVKVPETRKTENTSSKTPEREKAAERNKTERDNVEREKTEREKQAGADKNRERDSPQQDDKARPEQPQQQKPSDEESPQRDNTTGKDKTDKDKTDKDKATEPTESPEPEGAIGSDKPAEPGHAEESSGTPTDPAGEKSADSSSTQEEAPTSKPVNGTGTDSQPAGPTGEASTEGSVDGSVTEPADAAPETGSSEVSGEAASEQPVVPAETEEPTVPPAPVSDASTLRATVAGMAMAQIGQPHDAVSFIETVLTGAGYAPAPGGRDYLQLGSSVAIGEAAAGDLLYYTDASGQTFAAIYLGGGRAARGGGEDGQAVEFSLSEMASPPVVIRLAGQL